ncbi:unnamed protein product [Dicrocoelium dendriticum]|nr:unnamed protein product [Dicrocoelium dendriticum]
MDITEDWIKSRVKLAGENYANVKTLILQGTYDAKILNLGNSLLRFTRLKILDLSRNLLKSTKGIEHIYTLEVLNLYYNSIENLMETSFNCLYDYILASLDVLSAQPQVQRFADNMVDKRDSGEPHDHPLSTHDKSDIHRDVTSTEPSSAEPGNHRSGLHDAPVNDLIKSISDRALFTLLKNWIQEAVSESFARHARSNPSSVLKDTDSVSRNEDHDTRSDHFQFYKPAAGLKIKTASEYGPVVENRKLHFMEDRDTSRQVKALEEENSRLAMEVRVLRSRLQKYEQAHRRDRTLLVPNSSSNMDNPPNRSLVPDVPTGKYFSAFATPGLYPIDRCLQPTSHTSSGYLTGSSVFSVYGNKPKPWISDTPKPSPST